MNHCENVSDDSQLKKAGAKLNEYAESEQETAPKAEMSRFRQCGSTGLINKASIGHI